MMQEAVWVRTDITEKIVIEWANVARGQCAALGTGEPAGKMGFMDCPQQVM